MIKKSLKPPLPPKSLRQSVEGLLAQEFWKAAKSDLDKKGRLPLRAFWSHLNFATESMPDPEDPVGRGVLVCRIIEKIPNDYLRNLAPDIHLQFLQELLPLPDMKIRKAAMQRLFATVQPTQKYRDEVTRRYAVAAEKVANSMNVRAIRHQWANMKKAERLKIVKQLAKAYFSAFGWKKTPKIKLVNKRPSSKTAPVMFGVIDDQENITINTNKDAGWDRFLVTMHTVMHESQHAVMQAMGKGYIPALCPDMVAIMRLNQDFYTSLLNAAQGKRRHKKTDDDQMSLGVDGQDAFYNGQIFERDANDAADKMVRLIVSRSKVHHAPACVPR